MSLLRELRAANAFDALEPAARRASVVERLRAVVRLALERSRFYARDRALLERLRDEQDPEAFLSSYRRLAPLTKDDLVRAFDALVTDPELDVARCAAFDADHAAGDATLRTASGTYQVLKTSGTSGKVVYVVDQVANIRRVMAVVLFRALFRTAYRTGSFALFLPFVGPILRLLHPRPAPKRAARLPFFARIARALRPSVLVFVHRGNRSVYRGTTSHSQPLFVRLLVGVELVQNDRSLDEILDLAESVSPEFVFGLPSRIEWLARAQLRGEIAIAPRAIYVGGETLRPELSALFAEAFPHTLVFNTYGATETKAIAIACPECQELHLLEDIVHLELYDRDGRPVPDGVAAEQVFATSLRNHTLPVLRYQMTDVVVPLPDAGCRVRTRRIRVEGREPAFLWARRGDDWVPLNGRMLKERLTALAASGYHVSYREAGALTITLVDEPSRHAALEAATHAALAAFTAEFGGDPQTFFPRLAVRTVTPEAWNHEGGKLDVMAIAVEPDRAALPGGTP